MIDTLQTAGRDFTNLNARIYGGVMWSLKILMGRKLIRLVCILQTYELPLQQFINELDDSTMSKSFFRSHQKIIVFCQ